MNKRKIGSYYTPIRLANFIAEYCLSQIEGDNILVLEPSVGDGIFVEAINSYENNRNQNINLHIVEREENELQKAVNRQTNELINITSYNSDYLDFHNESNMRFSLIAGNPPYVKGNYLTDKQKIKIREIHLSQNLLNKKINNIWTAFLVSAITKLNDNGILAFVLPLELLQVKFTEEIRSLLKSSFERLEIFMFDKLQFQECKGQDTVLLIGYKRHQNIGTFYTTIKSVTELEQRNFTLTQNISVSESNKKWTHHFLSPEEHSFLENVKKDLKTVSHYVDNKAGIVTAANNYFIVDKNTLKEYSLSKYARPIVQKGFFVNGSVSFEEEDYENLVEGNKPSYLLDFNSLNTNRIPKRVKEYIELGEKEELHLRFKCKQRNHWYQVPNISEEPQAFFFKRAHQYPKLLRNDARVFVTDSAYKVQTKKEYNIDSFIYSFYNSLTLAFSELEGRYYGGGVLELTPNEFRILPIPYSKVEDFDRFKENFKDKNNIKYILEKYNYRILNKSLGLNKEEINRIESIRKKLINKRHRK